VDKRSENAAVNKCLHVLVTGWLKVDLDTCLMYVLFKPNYYLSYLLEKIYMRQLYTHIYILITKFTI